MLAGMWRKKNTPPLLVGLQGDTLLLKSVWQFLRKLGIIVPEDLSVALLSMNANDTLIYNKGICSTMFITDLFIRVRT